MENARDSARNQFDGAKHDRNWSHRGLQHVEQKDAKVAKPDAAAPFALFALFCEAAYEASPLIEKWWT
jgi:hypothetical protein